MAASSPAKRAPRKATPAKKTVAARPRVTLDLDALSKQRAYPDVQLPPNPFTFLLNEVKYELGDPRDSDWKLAMELAGNPFLLMRTALAGADDVLDDPTDKETRFARERHGLPMEPPTEGTEQAAHEAEEFPDGVPVCLIDRFTATHLPGWKLNALFQRWHEHYKIDLSVGKGILPTLLGQAE